MGILDIFRDPADEYEGSHTGRGRRGRSNPIPNFSSNEEFLTWLKRNKAFALYEGDGITALLDENDETMVPMYSTPELAEQSGGTDEFLSMDLLELWNLLKDQEAIKTINLDDGALIVSRDEIEAAAVGKQEPDESEEASSETPSEPEIDYPFPRSRRNRLAQEDEATTSSESESEWPQSESENFESEAEAFAGEEEVPEEAFEAPEESLDDSQNEEDYEEYIPEAWRTPAKAAEAPELRANYVAQWSPVREVPTRLIRQMQRVLDDENSGVTRIFMGTMPGDGIRQYALAIETDVEDLYIAELNLTTDRYETQAVFNDGNPLALQINNPKFEVYDAEEAKGKAPERTEEEMLDYLEKHYLFFPDTPEEDNGELKELIAFTNLTQIPAQFLMPFETFIIMRPADIATFLEMVPTLASAHINSFDSHHAMEIGRDDLMMIDHSRKKVLIVGLGLIGASLALAIKAGNDKAEIVGADNEEVLRIATTRGIIDQTTTDFESAAEKATHIILATPVDVTIDYIGRLAKLKLRKDVVITDTASTKQEVMAAANEAFSEKSRMTFIGGHPMAGSHKSGPNAADEKLFENAYYVLTKHHEGLEELLEGCHAKFIVMDADEHDAVTGQVSHLPHVLASALVLQSADYAKKHPRVENLAAGGFRDLTRIADSDADLWTSVMLSNTDDIVERIGNFQEQLDKIKTMLEEKDERAIKSFFENGKSERDQMEIHPGALEAYYDLFVSIPDESGSVLRVLSALESFSIVNIKINEGNREDIHGTLQISFKKEHDRERAREEVERRTKFDVVDK